MFRMCAMILTAVSLLADTGELKPIGSVSSRGAVRVSGTTLDKAEVPSWPVVSGDVIQTQTEPATMVLDDGTRLVVDPSSSVTLRMGGPGKLIVTLAAGAITYTISKKSSVNVIAGKQTVTLQPGASGSLALDNTKAAARDDKPQNSTQRQTQRQSRPVLSPHEP